MATNVSAASISLIPFESLDLPDGPEGEAIEAQVRSNLPVLDGVEAAQSEEERNLAYASIIAKQRAAFVQFHGDAYGLETKKVTTTQKLVPTTLASGVFCAA